MAVEFKDYYQTLGVARDASQDDIRKSFRKLAREFHPDVAKDKKRAEEKFKEINEAYEVLGDPAKRKKYDSLGANWNRSQPPPGWNQSGGRRAQPGGEAEEFEFHFGGTGFSDFFEQFFSGRGEAGGSQDFRGGPSARAASTEPMRGQDIQGDIMVTLNEAVSGSVRTIAFQKRNRATGRATEENFRVRIPIGVHEGQLIRVTGKGEEGLNGGAPGDLYLRVRFAQHPDFRVRGADLYLDLELAPWEAVLGTTVSIPALEGPVTVRVPAGAAKGQQLRVRAKGLPTNGGGRGDLYAVISIEIPTRVTEEERLLWEQLASKSTFNPRNS
ncbi:MAG TPA: J domain-containing protein [Verrucomicrobiae bacterium]|nr:J domain-containing protein [Verrucomicrobiae bacterium]